MKTSGREVSEISALKSRKQQRGDCRLRSLLQVAEEIDDQHSRATGYRFSASPLSLLTFAHQLRYLDDTVATRFDTTTHSITGPASVARHGLRKRRPSAKR